MAKFIEYKESLYNLDQIATVELNIKHKTVFIRFMFHKIGDFEFCDFDTEIKAKEFYEKIKNNNQ